MLSRILLTVFQIALSDSTFHRCSGKFRILTHTSVVEIIVVVGSKEGYFKKILELPQNHNSESSMIILSSKELKATIKNPHA